MKKIILVLLSLVLVFGLVACNNNAKAPEEAPKEATEEVKEEAKEEVKTEEKKDLIVFAAASMTETLEKIKTLYEEQNPNVEVVYTFDSSGTLKTQIEEGAHVDIFISAAQKQMNALDPEKGEVANDNVIDSATRIDLLENKVTLVVPNGSEKGITDFKDFDTDKVEKIALGNSDVPVGQYSEELLTNLGIWEKIQDKITFGSNVKEVTTWVSEGVVDAGIVYKTDAFSAGLDVVAEADSSLLKTPVVYPAALLNKSENKDEAQKFLEFLQGDEAKAIFEEVGFALVK